jgi:hypothetical protein
MPGPTTAADWIIAQISGDVADSTPKAYQFYDALGRKQANAHHG